MTKIEKVLQKLSQMYEFNKNVKRFKINKYNSNNAVYLTGEYDQRFGTFTGKESFEGDLEVLNDREKVLLKTKG